MNEEVRGTNETREGASQPARPGKPATKRSALSRARPRLTVSQLGPIQNADVTFGDLTVVVGPQATGKSLFLQALKLVIDRDQIHDTFRHHGMHFNGDADAFLDAYFGRGMSGALGGAARVVWRGKDHGVADFAKPTKGKARHERVFYIPAQRVMSLPGGVSQNFGQFNFGDPYTLRSFSDAVHDLIQNEFGAKGELFPAPNRLNPTLRKPVEDHLFGGNRLVIDDAGDYTKKLALSVPGNGKPLGFLSWSAGQREFAPMLMGLYWLCTTTNRRKTGETANDVIEWVVIEEPEMGLHPKGISAVLLMVLELLRRGYRVVVSTHSPVVLEMVWALQEFKHLGAEESDVRALFDLMMSSKAKELGHSALTKDYRVYFFDRQNAVRDISQLDPAAEDVAEAEWGGITGFSANTNKAIAGAVNRAQSRARRHRRGGTEQGV